MKITFCLLVGLFCASPLASAQTNPAPATLKDVMRQPWEPNNDSGYQRHWLLLGEFPAVIHQGMDRDFLTEHGGEANIQPVAGMSHKLPDGTVVAWRDFNASGDIIDLHNAFSDPGATNVVIYAYTTIERAKAGPALLSMGSDDGISVWLNGVRVHHNVVSRAMVADEDLAEVNFAAGANRILVKIDQGDGGWGFAFRVLEANSFQHPTSPPRIQLQLNQDKTLSLATDNDGETSPIHFSVMAAGGNVLAERSARRGSKVTINVATWPDGPYEIRVRNESPLGKQSYIYESWYKGDLLAALNTVVASAPPGRATTPEAGHLQMLAEMVKDRMNGKMDSLEGKPLPVLQRILLEYAELRQEMHPSSGVGRSENRNGVGPVHASGFVRLSYIDDIDGSTQFCRAYLPAHYNSSRKWPLVLSLHGSNGENPVYVRWWLIDVRHNPLADDHDLIFIEPHGRGNTSFQGIGERDVMRCLQLARQQFRIDDDRVYLMGQSMGGGGTWYLGSHHPDVFAAIAPEYGGWDSHTYLTAQQKEKMTPRQLFDMEAGSSFASADSLLNTPIFVNHGDADQTVPVDNSRYAVRMLQRWGYDIRYREHPGKGHSSLGNDDEVMEWFLQHKRTLYPAKVRLRAAELSSASAYWVKVEQREDPHEFILGQAELVAPNAIRLDTKNALAVTLTPGSPLIDPAKPLRISWNQEETKTVMLKDGQVRLLAKGYVPAKLEKSPGLPGAIGDVIQTPFALVVGTIAEDSLTRALCQRKADTFASYWQNFQHQTPRIVKDTELSDADAARYSLILIGGSEANAVTRKLAAALPLNISGSVISIDGHAFKAPDAGVMMVYPNPLNASRYVLVIASTSPSGLYFVPDIPSSDSDFLIRDGLVSDPHQGRVPANANLVSGSFDRQWHIAPSLLEEGDAKARAGAPIYKLHPDLTPYIVGGKQIKPETLDLYAGEYRISNRNISVVKNGENLVLKVSNQLSIDLIAASENEFDFVSQDTTMTFVKDADGKVTHALIKGGNGQPTEAIKVK